MNNVKLFLNEIDKISSFFLPSEYWKMLYILDSENQVIRLDIQTIFIKLQPVNWQICEQLITYLKMASPIEFFLLVICEAKYGF